LPIGATEGIGALLRKPSAQAALRTNSADPERLDLGDVAASLQPRKKRDHEQATETQEE
jgi:hypothetical protein